jgi:hypothetical protein
MSRTIRRQTSNEYWIIGPVALIDVSTKKWPAAIAMVNAEDLTSVVDGGRRWHAVKRRRTDTTLYAVRGNPGCATKESMHRILTQDLGDLNPDHINRDGLDNRKANLRAVTPPQNCANRRKHQRNNLGIIPTSKYKGVHWDKSRKKWLAAIYPGGNRKRLGYFADEAEAALAYDMAAYRIFGEYAYANSPRLERLETSHV